MQHDHSHACCNHNHSPNDPAPRPKWRRVDWIFWGSLAIVTVFGLRGFLHDDPATHDALGTFSLSVWKLIETMWWGVLLGMVSVGILTRIPREFIMSILGTGGGVVGILRATAAGVLLDLCSHGILLIGSKLYERGATLGQTFAFLIASPWNSFSLVLVMIALIGWQWTLAFVCLSLVIAIVTGLIVEHLVKRGVLPHNPNTQPLSAEFDFWGEAAKKWRNTQWNIRLPYRIALDGARESRMILRWLLFGIVLAALIQTFVTTENFQQYFGPTLLGLLFTMIGAILIEVCSEGATPIASDLLTRAGAPGNAFAFLMGGVTTDYTELFVLRQITGSWKAALFLPLVTVPQVVLIALILNSNLH